MHCVRFALWDAINYEHSYPQTARTDVTCIWGLPFILLIVSTRKEGDGGWGLIAKAPSMFGRSRDLPKYPLYPNGSQTVNGKSVYN